MNPKSCYGSMLPDFDRLAFNRTMPGKVFSVFVGSVGIGVQEKRTEFHAEQWSNASAANPTPLAVT